MSWQVPISMILLNQLSGLIKITPNNYQPGTLENGEPMSDHTKVEPTNFQPPRVDNGKLGAKLTVAQEKSRCKKFHDGHSQSKWQTVLIRKKK